MDSSNHAARNLREQIISIIIFDTVILASFSLVAFATTLALVFIEIRTIETILPNSDNALSIAAVPPIYLGTQPAHISEVDLEVTSITLPSSDNSEDYIWKTLRTNRMLLSLHRHAATGISDAAIPFEGPVVGQMFTDYDPDPHTTKEAVAADAPIESAGAGGSGLYPSDSYDGYQISTIISTQ